MRRGYSPAEVETLRALAMAGRTKRQIAAELGRSFKSVTRKCLDLGIATRGTPGPRPGEPRPSGPGPAGVVSCRLGAHVMARLQREAEARDVSVPRLVQRLVTIAVEAALVGAVLDDENESASVAGASAPGVNRQAHTERRV